MKMVSASIVTLVFPLKHIVMSKADTINIRPQLDRACGIDIHKNKVTICYYISNKPQEVREYGTFTCELEQIRDDIVAHNIKDVLMESTGVYWIALCSLLMAAGMNVRVANPLFIKNMPKEKTDKKDARWLCKLLVNGLVRNSFVAGEDQRAFRDLCRMRTKYRNHITQSQNRIVKNLERRNIKLRSVVSNMDTVSAMEIVAGIAAGETDIEKLVSLCRTKLKKKKAEMRKALHGVITQHDRLMLQGLLDDIVHYRKRIKNIEEQIKKHTQKINEELIKNLREIKGIGEQSTQIILAEIGDNVKPFATPDKLAAWVGVAPGNKESAGKTYYSGTRKGNVYLRTALLQVAWAAVRTKNSYWRALYYHLTRRMPIKKAIVAIARKLVRLIYKVINRTKTYVEYGADYFHQHLQERLSQKRNHNIVIKPA
jgi:transposase